MDIKKLLDLPVVEFMFKWIWVNGLVIKIWFHNDLHLNIQNYYIITNYTIKIENQTYLYFRLNFILSSLLTTKIIIKVVKYLYLFS